MCNNEQSNDSLSSDDLILIRQMHERIKSLSHVARQQSARIIELRQIINGLTAKQEFDQVLHRLCSDSEIDHAIRRFIAETTKQIESLIQVGDVKKLLLDYANMPVFLDLASLIQLYHQRLKSAQIAKQAFSATLPSSNEWKILFHLQHQLNSKQISENNVLSRPTILHSTVKQQLKAKLEMIAEMINQSSSTQILKLVLDSQKQATIFTREVIPNAKQVFASFRELSTKGDRIEHFLKQQLNARSQINAMVDDLEESSSIVHEFWIRFQQRDLHYAVLMRQSIADANEMREKMKQICSTWKKKQSYIENISQKQTALPENYKENLRFCIDDASMLHMRHEENMNQCKNFLENLSSERYLIWKNWDKFLSELTVRFSSIDSMIQECKFRRDKLNRLVKHSLHELRQSNEATVRQVPLHHDRLRKLEIMVHHLERHRTTRVE